MSWKRKTPPAGSHGGASKLHSNNISNPQPFSQEPDSFVPLGYIANQIVERIKRQMLERGELPL